MSLRKSPQLTPALLAAARQNAQHSTGPRSAAAKQNSKLNALKHGAYVSDENQRQAMLALGEDPQEFENLKQELMSACPGDALWEKQVQDLAWLYEDDGPRMENIEKIRKSDNTSEHSQGAEAVEDLKMNDRRENVIENKGSLFNSSRRSGNVLGNKGSYAQNPGILLKTKGVIGNAELLTTGLEGRGFSPAVTRPS